MTLTPLDLLDSGNFQTYNRKVARELGSVNAAIMLSELINRYNYHKDKGELLTYKKYKGVWFYYTVEKCEERTVLSRKEQGTAIKILEKRGLFRKHSIGIPPKRHFCLDIEKILAFVCGLKRLFIKAEKGAISGPKRAERDGQKGLNNKEPQEEPKEEPQKEREGVPPLPPPSTPKKASSIKIKRAQHVRTTEEEHLKLLEGHTEEQRQQAYLALSEWKEDTPSSKWKKSDYLAINRWVFDSIKKKKGNNGKSRANPNLTPEQAKAYDELF